MRVGDAAEVTRCVTSSQLRQYVELAGLNRLPEATPEPLIAGMFSYLLGVELPGRGTNYLKQDFVFHSAHPVGKPLTARVEITRLRPEKGLVDLATTAWDSSGEQICQGRALVYVIDVETATEEALKSRECNE